MIPKRFSSRGQSLVEAMIAISLLVTGFLGLFTLLSRSFFLGRVVVNETTATYLASEGVELAKNLIDHDVYAGLGGVGGGWGSCFNVPVGGQGEDFHLDYNTFNCPPPLSPQPDVPLKFDAQTDLYNYATGVKTVFFRQVRVTVPSAGNGNEIDVNSIVTWSTGPITSQSVNIEDHFYNWHP
jgi:hypothetical protein